MPSADLYSPEYTQLTQDCQTFIAEHQDDSKAAQVLLSRVRNLRTNLKTLDAGDPQAATWIKTLENNILELFPIVYQTVDRNNGRRDVVAAQHLGFLKDANDKFALYKPKANNPNLTKAEKDDYLKFWEELKNIIAQMQDFVEISQRLKGDNVIIQNDALEKAQQMLGEVEQWPMIADRINQRQTRPNPSPLVNDLQNEFAARANYACEIGSGDAAVVSNPWNLPPQPLTPFENAMVILDKSPKTKEQIYHWEISKDQYTISKINNPAVYDTKKSPAENAAHIRDLDRMLLAYALGRDPSLWGTPIEIDGTDAMSRAILMTLCEYHDLPYKNLVDTQPITDKSLLYEIDKQADIECKNQPQLPRTKFTPPPIFGDTAPNNLQPPPSIAVDTQWSARAIELEQTISQLEEKIVNTLEFRKDIRSELQQNSPSIQGSINKLAQDAHKIVQNDSSIGPFANSNYQFYLNTLEKKQTVLNDVQALFADFENRVTQILKWPENPSQFQKWASELQTQQNEMAAMLNQFRAAHPDSSFSQAMTDYLETHWHDYNEACDVVAKLNQQQQSILSKPLSKQEMQQAQQEIIAGHEQLVAMQNNNAEKILSQYLPDLVFQIQVYLLHLANFEKILQEVVEAPSKAGPYVAIPAIAQQANVANEQYGRFDLPAGVDAVGAVGVSLPAPNLEYQGLPASSPHYQAISHPDNANNQAQAIPMPNSSEPVSANAAGHYKRMPRRETTLARENNAGWENLAAAEHPYDKIGLASQSQSNANTFASNLPTLVLNQEQWDRILPTSDYHPIQLAQDAPALPNSQQYQVRPEPVHGQYVQVNRQADDANTQMQIQNRSRSALQAPARTWPASDENKENVADNASVRKASEVKVDIGNSIDTLVQKKISETQSVSTATTSKPGKIKGVDNSPNNLPTSPTPGNKGN